MIRLQNGNFAQMNISNYTYLINKPDAVNERQSNELEKIITEFPYFQSARVLHLKHLYNQESFRYNNTLKNTAAYTCDRNILFDFITSPQFKIVQNGIYEQKIAELMNMAVIDSEIVKEEILTTTEENTVENSIKKSIQLAGNQEEKTAEEKLEIGKPLEFTQQEKHSFHEWLQLSRIQPIERKEKQEAKEPEPQKQLKHIDLIDKFIENTPKIPQISKDTVVTKTIPTEENTYLMTETLAKVYLEQKKYLRAIQAYEILILKNPEKSSFFANRIQEIKNLQQNNN